MHEMHRLQAIWDVEAQTIRRGIRAIGQRTASYLRRNGFLDMWFLFFTGHMLTLGAAAAFITFNPEVLS